MAKSAIIHCYLAGNFCINGWIYFWATAEVLLRVHSVKLDTWAILKILDINHLVECSLSLFPTLVFSGIGMIVRKIGIDFDRLGILYIIAHTAIHPQTCRAAKAGGVSSGIIKQMDMESIFIIVCRWKIIPNAGFVGGCEKRKRGEERYTAIEPLNPPSLLQLIRQPTNSHSRKNCINI